MSETALRCENYAIFKQNYTQKLLISFKISYYCCFGLRGNLEFPDFLQKKFYNINYWLINFELVRMLNDNKSLILNELCSILIGPIQKFTSFSNVASTQRFSQLVGLGLGYNSLSFFNLFVPLSKQFKPLPILL